jgi:hypothetical protein
VYGGNLYAAIQRGSFIDFGILDIKTAKRTTKIVTFPTNYVLASTASRLMVPTADGAFHIGLEDITTGLPYLYTVDVDNKTTNIVPIDTPCALWQLTYDDENNVLYGINVQDQDDATLFTIDMVSGATKAIGTFPLHMDSRLLKKRDQVDACYEVLGGGVIIDADTQTIYLYYSSLDPNGLYFEAISPKDASVINHGIFQYDLPSPVFGDTYNTLFSIDIGDGPKYDKFFCIFRYSNC